MAFSFIVSSVIRKSDNGKRLAFQIKVDVTPLSCVYCKEFLKKHRDSMVYVSYIKIIYMGGFGRASVTASFTTSFFICC